MRAAVSGVLVLAFSLACGGMTGGDTGIPVPLPVPVPIGGGGGAVTGPDCVSFCNQSAICFAAAGRSVGPDEMNCEVSCAPGGSYTRMGPASFLCATKACGPAFDECSGAGLATLLSAAMSGGSMEPPSTWPAGFPFFAGGMPYDAGMGGPITVSALLFTLPPADLASVVRAELKRTGWTITSDEDVGSSQPGTSGKVRMTVEKGGPSISVSIYAAEGQTVLLVMQ